MKSEEWNQIDELFQQALNLAPSERAALLNRTCDGKESLRRQVESLLAHDEQSDSFLKQPPGEIATQLLTLERSRFQEGQFIGHYQVIGCVGAGGMGEVYRAHDGRLNRDVAIKVLPGAFVNDRDRLSRLQREARLLASLHHPNIAVIHGLEDSGDTHALIMELVEGPTLADRIRQNPIPIDEALAIAKQICEALEYAHEHGIVHRDLKPANIKITPDGNVKILDFGLAKVRDRQMSLTASPPIVTASGMILGTAAYMSPEQAKGQETDRTCDLWAFGCLLYEMLSGHRLFVGDSAAEILGRILETEPDWRLLPDETPDAVRNLLRRCLRKNPKHRLHDMADARIEIEEAEASPTTNGSVLRLHSPRKKSIALVATLMVLFVGIASVVVAGLSRRQVPAQEVRFEIPTPATLAPESFALSPDGLKIVYAAESDGVSHLWLRFLNSVSAQLLPQTNGASLPFWSPDSRSIGFFAERELKRIDLDTGSLQKLADAPLPSGGTWNDDGVILFALTAVYNPIFRIPAKGGERVAVTRVETPQQLFHSAPVFLPDGRHFFFHVRGSRPETSGIYVSELGSPAARRLLDADPFRIASPRITSSGELVFLLKGNLFIQGFDVVRGQLIGNATAFAEHVISVSTSAAGPIAYRVSTNEQRQQFAWYDRSGKQLMTVGDPNVGSDGAALSSDGTHLALTRFLEGNFSIWTLDAARGLLTRLTSDESLSVSSLLWSPDGSRVVFSASRGGPQDLYMKKSNGAGAEEGLLGHPYGEATSWSHDGRLILYDSRVILKSNVWALPLDMSFKPSGQSFPVIQEFESGQAQFSPDDQWIAYQSNVSGRVEIYATRFRNADGKSSTYGLPGEVGPPPPLARGRRISTNGGTQVRWAPDGKELFYLALDGHLMAVPIMLPPKGNVPIVGNPVPLFPVRTRDGGNMWSQWVNTYTYMVSPDGRRFLMNTILEQPTAPVTVIMNWTHRP